MLKQKFCQVFNIFLQKLFLTVQIKPICFVFVITKKNFMNNSANRSQKFFLSYNNNILFQIIKKKF